MASNILINGYPVSGTNTTGIYTGLNGQIITGDSAGSWTVAANGTNQNVRLTPSGSGVVKFDCGSGYTLDVTNAYLGVSLQGSAANLLLGVSGGQNAFLTASTFAPLNTGTLTLGINANRWNELYLSQTITAAGTTGNQTINKPSGRVNFAAAATSLVVTNSLVTASSVIIASVMTNDTTLKSVQAVAAAGSFTLFGNAAATAETKVSFLVLN